MSSSSDSSKEFAGKVALVTGASSGIGEAIAKALASAGAQVVINGRDQERLKAVHADIVKAGGAATSHIGDVRFEKTHQELVDLAVKTYGALHFAVNNAGMAHFATLENITGEQIDDVIDINLKSTLFGLKYQLSTIGRFSSEAEWGRIINLSSAASAPRSSLADMGGLVYSVSKAGIDQATRQGASEGRHKKVLVNAIAPGPIFTPAFKKMGVPDRAAGDAMGDQMTLMGRAGSVEDTTRAVFFLLGKGGNFINGAILPVDGGAIVK